VTRLGIMQGRLVPPEDGRFQSFPRQRWADEFPLAARAGLDCIEWIYDEYGADANPIATDAGIEAMRKLTDTTGVRVVSLCADYFMDRPLVRVEGAELMERVKVLDWLIGRAGRLGIERIVLPFVDASRVGTPAELEQVATILGRAAGRAETAGVELHVESSLDPLTFAELLGRLPTESVKVNYDTGNSASLGYDPREEFRAYGARVGSIHVKDRKLGGGTVPLGTGDTDLAAVFDCLRRLDYSGDIMLQVARGTPGSEVAWAAANRAVVLDLLVDAAARHP
jgi:L-ribulose-5-phosphate 3-epimerase